MNRKPIKIRARLKNGVTTVKALIYHPRETGRRKDKATGKEIPAHFIQEIRCSHNGEMKVALDLGISVSKNPYLQFELEGGEKGDSVELSWRDNLGKTDAIVTKIT